MLYRTIETERHRGRDNTENVCLKGGAGAKLRQWRLVVNLKKLWLEDWKFIAYIESHIDLRAFTSRYFYYINAGETRTV